MRPAARPPSAQAGVIACWVGMQAIVGTSVAAQLMGQAGGLANLAKVPSGNLQVHCPPLSAAAVGHRRCARVV